MGSIKVLHVVEDPILKGRLLITGKAQSHCMASRGSGNRQLILRDGEQMTASIAAAAFPGVEVNQEIDGSRFCRFAINHIRQMT
jgi:hypothetical protein